MWFPPTVWMDYKPRRINPKREKLLDLHFTSNCGTFPNRSNSSFFLSTCYCIVDSIYYQNVLFPAITLVVMILPLLVIIGGISGYIGSKLRYKKGTSKILKQRFT